MKFRRIFWVICDISSKFWRFVRWTKFKNHRFKKIFKIFDLIRRNQNENIFERVNDFDIKTRLLIEFFFSNTTNANLSNISTYNYSNVVDETFELINENEIKKSDQAMQIKQCIEIERHFESRIENSRE
jgi:hypothetical protein